MSGTEKQYTTVGIVCLVLTVIPVVGILVNRRAERRFPAGTNANTLAMIGGVLAVWFTLLWIPIALGGLFILALACGWVTPGH